MAGLASSCETSNRAKSWYRYGRIWFADSDLTIAKLYTIETKVVSKDLKLYGLIVPAT